MALTDLIEAFRKVANEDITEIRIQLTERGERDVHEMTGIDTRYEDLPS